jgi:hypothetical protein
VEFTTHDLLTPAHRSRVMVELRAVGLHAPCAAFALRENALRRGASSDRLTPPSPTLHATSPGGEEVYARATVEQGDRPNMPIHSPIFAPAAVLVLWSLVMLAWLVLSRVPAMSKAGIDLMTVVGGRGVNLEGVIADRVNWKAHNYAHLMEQPTLFYATVVILGLVGAGEGLNLQLAWAYVALRIVHSIVQATWNRVAVRFTLFALATAALLVLAINAARATL